jgi:hypothetical protein
MTGDYLALILNEGYIELRYGQARVTEVKVKNQRSN